MKPARSRHFLPPDERVPHPKITPAVSRAEAEACWWVNLTAHYLEHQSGPQWVLMCGGRYELIRTYECPDCQRYGRAFDAHQRGDGISAEMEAIWT